VTLPEEVSLHNQILLIRAREWAKQNANSRNKEKGEQREDVVTTDSPLITSPQTSKSPSFTSITTSFPVLAGKYGLSPEFQRVDSSLSSSLPSLERTNADKIIASKIWRDSSGDIQNASTKKVSTTPVLLPPSSNISLTPSEPSPAPHARSPFSASFSSFEKFVSFYKDFTTVLSSWSKDACGEGYSFLFFELLLADFFFLMLRPTISHIKWTVTFRKCTLFTL
jgi:hypothetical protein